MYKSGKWLLSFRNRYGYTSTFKKKIYMSRLGPYDHHDHYKIEALRGNHNVHFDIQNIELHLSHHKTTPKLRFGINHPTCWVYRNGEYTMINKEESLLIPPNEWNNDLCYFLFFLTLQELSTRVNNYKKYTNKYKKTSYGHFKAIIKTLFILRMIVAEAKRRNIYF